VSKIFWKDVELDEHTFNLECGVLNYLANIEKRLDSIVNFIKVLIFLLLWMLVSILIYNYALPYHKEAPSKENAAPKGLEVQGG
jgi:hypothetical protein